MVLTKTKFITLLISLVSPFTLSAQWLISGGLYTPYHYQPSASSGLNGVYLLYGMRQANVSFRSDSDQPMQCFRYSLSALQADPVESIQNGNEVNIVAPEAGYGYFVEQNGAPVSYMWLIDYAPLQLSGLSLQVDPAASDCDFTRLIFERNAPDISYCWINGRTEQIAREFLLEYKTLQWDDTDKTYREVPVNETVKGYRELSVTAPFCNTAFSLTGDQFMRYWNIPATVATPEYEAVAVTGEAFARQHVRDAGNELDKESGELGGSAPVEITFTGYHNQPVATYQAWEFSRRPDFEVIDATYNDPELTFSFEEEGTTYVRYLISNATNSCEKTVRTFTINTSESSLQVPNVFTPESASGNNQVFKVAYKSILKFEGWIFNRWGNQLFHWTNPADGWDGKVNGKVVPTGAYYYVIEAEGVGGKKYKLKGDINVLRTRN